MPSASLELRLNAKSDAIPASDTGEALSIARRHFSALGDALERSLPEGCELSSLQAPYFVAYGSSSLLPAPAPAEPAPGRRPFRPSAPLRGSRKSPRARRLSRLESFRSRLSGPFAARSAGAPSPAPAPARRTELYTVSATLEAKFSFAESRRPEPELRAEIAAFSEAFASLARESLAPAGFSVAPRPPVLSVRPEGEDAASAPRQPRGKDRRDPAAKAEFPIDDRQGERRSDPPEGAS